MLDDKQVEFLNELKENEIILIVEGKRDRKVLERLNLKNIVDISGKRLEDIADKVEQWNKGSVTILTDYDEEGIKNYKRLAVLLKATSVKVDDSLRIKFRKIFKIHRIEEMVSYFK